ncbi:MAG: TatD family hydrolase [Sulfuricellaceae bacterium]|nr:TatD family hydrolase [Sulfuricellaceae bacterium]
MLIDSHCHLDFPDLSVKQDEILANMKQQQVAYALCVAVNLEDFPRVLALAESHDNLFASVGVHPDYEDIEEPTVERLAELARHPKVIAIGETGLDYFRLSGDLEWQRQRFRNHIRAAKQCGKPLIIHTREAAEDTLRIMEEEGASQVGGVMHCFTESWDVAQRAMAMNFLISFSGIVTFKKATNVQDVARLVPLDRLLVETDSPYLAPAPHRGKVNQPAFVRHVAEEIAKLKEIDLATVALSTSNNFTRLFKLDEIIQCQL